MSYNQNLGNLEGIKVVFKGSGSCTWVKLRTATNNNLLYEENFTNCNNICPSCNNIQDLNQFFIPSGSYDSAIELNSTSRISNNSNVEFKSPNSINLNAGFEVIQGAVFTAISAPCNN